MFRSDFTRLSALKLPQLDSILRTGIFARAIQKSPDARDIARNLHTEDASYEALSDMNNFVDHIVNQQVFADYFKNDKAQKSFARISDTAALQKQLSKAQAAPVSGGSTLQIVPSRGTLLELSGHIGDACWASQYESIAAEFPNITALTFVRNPGGNTERIVGAALAIDTKDETTGEPVMVVRGINPIENYINSIKADEFMDAVLDYASAAAGERKLAIVIDGMAGMAATNRPVVSDYLKQVIKSQKVIQKKALQLAEDSTFNGYTLAPGRHSAYVVRP
jgi:hypothetical protein